MVDRLAGGPTGIEPDVEAVRIAYLVDLPAQPAEPRPIQEGALRALAQTRIDGFRAGMVTMATGLGKTWLAAFDAVQAQADRVLLNRTP